MKFPTIQELGQKVAESALDEFKYKGKTIREWADTIISQEEPNIVQCRDCKYASPNFEQIPEGDEMPSEPKWIPVTERLPEEGERVLTTHLGGINPEKQVIEHTYQCGKFTRGWDMDMDPSSPTFGQRYMGKVIAWMPLPEPYRKEGE